MRQLVMWFLISSPFFLYSQQLQDTTAVSNRYFEDQFYAGITYNFILNLPGEEPNKASQRNFSYGLQAGFIKDIPFNNDRTFGVGLGLGLALNTYYSDIRAVKNDIGITYELVDGVDDFKRSKIETHILEVPFEFRWRNSDPEVYSFWRIYAGIKLGYVFNARSKYVLEDLKESFRNPEVQSFQYGLTFNFGYHNFNMHAYYSLTSLFNDSVTLDGSSIEISPLRIGLIFYIL